MKKETTREKSVTITMNIEYWRIVKNLSQRNQLFVVVAASLLHHVLLGWCCYPICIILVIIADADWN